MPVKSPGRNATPLEPHSGFSGGKKYLEIVWDMLFLVVRETIFIPLRTAPTFFFKNELRTWS